MESAIGDQSGATQQADEFFPVVAIGASAGGLEAFTSLLRQLPPDTGMAFVFIQHLAPTHESMLPQLLSRDTSMLVNPIEDGVVLSPNLPYRHQRIRFVDHSVI
jgi:two-component system, chemotaxis family, CheB/CheR fusion protein